MSDANQNDDADTPAGEDDPFYAFKASLAGAPMILWLRRDSLEWSFGRRSGVIRYDRIRRVRMAYRPASLQSHRFITEIWAHDQPKLQIVSTTWQGLVLQQRQDAPYAAFVTELHRRLAAAGVKARFHTGLPVVLYAIGVAIIGAAAFAFVLMVFRTLGLADWRVLAVLGILFATFAWQLGNYFIRNQPAEYRPDAIPPRVLPRT